VGEYSVLGLLGAGGMGEVYRARDARLGRDVAIKVLPPSLLSDPEARARFHREARAVAALNHPNIVTIHEVGEYEHYPFIAFELVAGETLKERIERGPMAAAEALAVAIPLAEGLRHAHESGVIHRDLKPHNVMVRPDGQVKILDFGLGKVTAAPVSGNVTTMAPSLATEAGTLLGTAGYTAPEHLKGHPVDARSDQFAFGAILYELLTGRRAFLRETTVQTLSAIIEDEPTPLAALAPRAPRPLTAIVSRCLQKQPERRYATTADLVRALRDAHEQTHSSGVGVWPRWRAVAALVVIAGLAAAAIRLDWFRRHPPSTTVSPVSMPSKRIAVLPFSNIGGGEDGKAFADGMVELLNTSLSEFERANQSLVIVPATEVRRGGVTNAEDARSRLGVTHAVSGSVIQRSQDRVGLTLNLTDAVTLRQIDGKVLDGSSEDIAALQDAAVAALARMLGLQPGAGIVRRVPQAADAYMYYVQGLGYLQRFERIESVDSAIELFTLSLDRDSEFALAHAALGEAYWRKYDITKDTALVKRALAEVARAVERDKDNPKVRLTSGIVAHGTGQYETAIRELQRVIELDATNADAYRELGRAYEALQRYDLAEATYRNAIDIRRNDWSTYAALGRFLYARKRYEPALAEFKRVAALTPDNAAAFSNIGGIEVLLKRHDAAEASFKKSISIRETGVALSNLGTLYFNRGQFAESANVFKRAVELGGNDYRLWGNLGSAYQWVPDVVQSQAAYQTALKLALVELRVNPRRAVLLADLADFSQALNRRGDARQYAKRALSTDAGSATVLFKVAVVHAGLGDHETALALLRKAMDVGLSRDDIESSRALEALRKDQRYLTVLDK
jgi:serine/threonine protein kinase/tetratricopeptide (TPR) repeat protein